MPWDSGVVWAAATVPARHTLIRFRWKYRDAGKSYAGRAAVRIAPPDSLRIDYAGPFNWGAGAALVVGDTTVWADPEKKFRSLVPAVRTLWAALGDVAPAPLARSPSRWRGACTASRAVACPTSRRSPSCRSTTRPPSRRSPKR